MKIISALSALFFTVSLIAQPKGDQADTSLAYPMISVQYGFQLPAGELADRFGFSHGIGGGVYYKWRNNLILGSSGYYQFGNQVKERSILAGIASSQGYIINVDGEEATIILYQRGYALQANAGYVLPVFSPNKNSGFMGLLGVGFLQHRIRIEDPIKKTPQIADDYQKGYDRMTNGVMLTEFFGYQYFSSYRLLNFFVGVEFAQAFTRNRRSYNFDEQRRDDHLRLDALTTFKISWNIPLYKRIAREFYYY
jgi:hypothetical protein